MSVIYSTKLRAKAARAVLDARDFAAQKKALDHWGVFEPVPSTPWLANEGEVEYVERLFGALHQVVSSWYLTYLEARIEALESPGEIARERDYR